MELHSLFTNHLQSTYTLPVTFLGREVKDTQPAPLKMHCSWKLGPRGTQQAQRQQSSDTCACPASS